jgi:hypothetical protein
VVLPNWLASTLAKKITRRALSVHRSNIVLFTPVLAHLTASRTDARSKGYPTYQRDISGGWRFSVGGKICNPDK